VPLGGQLPHRVAINLHLHHGFISRGEVLAVAGGQLNACEQPVIEGNGQETFVLLLHLGQQAGGAALEDALHATFRGAAPTALTGDAHQHPVAIPGVVELVVADVDVFAAVVPQGEAEAFAAAAQARFDQPFILNAADAGLCFLEHANAHEGCEGNA
jgi:hypothetical protein